MGERRPRTWLYWLLALFSFEALAAQASDSSGVEPIAPADQSVSSPRTPRKRTSDFGFRMELQRPSFQDKMAEIYPHIYGDPQNYLSIAGWRRIWGGRHVALYGFGRFGYYTDEGYAIQRKADLAEGLSLQNIDVKSFEADKNGPLVLTLVPLQIGGQVSFHFPRASWLMINTWLSLENMYIQEVRVAEQRAASSSDNEPLSRVNADWYRGLAFGASGNIKLNSLDERSVHSLELLGIGSIYATIFGEMVKGLGEQRVPFDRLNLGIGFTFESSR